MASTDLFEVSVNGSISSFPSGFNGMVLFDHKKKDKNESIYLVVSDLRNAKMLKSIGTVIMVENIAEEILKQYSDFDLKTLLVPLGGLIAFNNFSPNEIGGALNFSISKVIGLMKFPIANHQYQIAVKFFDNKEKKKDGIVYINFDDAVEPQYIAVIMYVLRRMRWNLPLNELDPERRNSKTYCFFKAKKGDWKGKKNTTTEKLIEQSEIVEKRSYQTPAKKAFKPRNREESEPKEKEVRPSENRSSENRASERSSSGRSDKKITSWADVEDDKEEKKEEKKEKKREVVKSVRKGRE